MQFLRQLELADFFHDQCGKQIIQAISSALKSNFQSLKCEGTSVSAFVARCVGRHFLFKIHVIISSAWKSFIKVHGSVNGQVLWQIFLCSGSV